jgi:hypothetical protein
VTEIERQRADIVLAEQAARFLALPLDPAHLPGIAANLALLQSHAARILALDLPSETEPAPVFVP